VSTSCILQLVKKDLTDVEDVRGVRLRIVILFGQSKIWRTWKEQVVLHAKAICANKM